MKLQVQIKVLKKYTGYSGTFPRYAPENFLWDNRKRKWKLQTTGSFQHIANHHVHSKVRNSVSSILSFQFINPIHKLTQSPFLFIDRALKIFLF